MSKSTSRRKAKTRVQRSPTMAPTPAQADVPQERDTGVVSLNELTALFDDDIQPQVERKCIHYRPFLRSCLAPVSVGDLLIVEQTLCGYEPNEIAQIENVMASERREFSTRDLNRITETTESSFEREVEESQSTKVDERFSLSIQSQEAQRQQTAVSGNVSVSYRAPAFSASIGVNASYSNAKDSSTRPRRSMRRKSPRRRPSACAKRLRSPARSRLSRNP